MATSTDKIADARARDMVYVLKNSRSVFKRQANLIDLAIADILMQLAKRQTKDGTLTTVRLQAVLDSLKGISRSLYDSLEEFTKEDIKELAVYESAAALAAIQEGFPVKLDLNKVSSVQIAAAAKARPFQGRFLREWYRDQEFAKREQYRAAVKLGFVEGETVSQISQRVRDIGNLEKRQAETIARTALNHTTNVAMQEVTKANTAVLKGEEWVSVLDGRTSAICQARDGNVYPIGEGPMPPAHPNCRSVRVPKTKSWKELGFEDLEEDDDLDKRPFVADTRKVKDIPKSQRDSVIGQTTEKSYNDWLRTQPRGFVEDVLGPTKAKLYLDEEISLDKFVDRTGSSLTLDQIAKRNNIDLDEL